MENLITFVNDGQGLLVSQGYADVSDRRSLELCISFLFPCRNIECLTWQILGLVQHSSEECRIGVADRGTHMRYSKFVSVE